MKYFYMFFFLVFFLSCFNNKEKKEVKERSHTSWCDCMIVSLENKHNSNQKGQDFFESCNTYFRSLSKEQKKNWVEEGQECYDDYLWSFGLEENDNLGANLDSFESILDTVIK